MMMAFACILLSASALVSLSQAGIVGYGTNSLAGHGLAVAAAPAYAAVAAGPIPIAVGNHGHEVDYYAHPQYAYNYGVADGLTGDAKTQHEVRDGDVVKGSYSVAEADGTLRVVEYSADDVHGFNAVVKRIGPSLHPATAGVAPLAVGYAGHGLVAGHARHY